MKPQKQQRRTTTKSHTKHLGDKAIVNRLLKGAADIDLLLADPKVLTMLPKGVRTQLVVDFKRYVSQVRQAASYVIGEKVYKLSVRKR